MKRTWSKALITYRASFPPMPIMFSPIDSDILEFYGSTMIVDINIPDPIHNTSDVFPEDLILMICVISAFL